MSNVETTRRDLVPLEGFVMCPVTWASISEGDTVQSANSDGLRWHVAKLEPAGEHVMVRLAHGRKEHVLELHVEDDVWVLQDPAGMRLAEHHGSPAVRARRKR